MSVVLDTCALIWWSLDPGKLSAKNFQLKSVPKLVKLGLDPEQIAQAIDLPLQPVLQSLKSNDKS